MWGGRFASGPAEIMQRINASIGVDRRLWRQDIAGSRAHAAMLVRQGILRQADGEAIALGLDQIEKEIADGRFAFKVELEDIHTNIESRLRELIGAPAGRLHTARSRNDQVAVDFRLWLREAIDGLDAQLVELTEAFLDRAEEHAATIMPGFTHLQVAQPVTFGHHLLAYVEMLSRDRGRLADCRGRLNESPLGAGALAGTSFPIDPAATAAALGFARPMANSMDAVSARDFAIEFLAAGAILATHLSRFAEELVLWTSEGFRFVALGDAFTTGSSIMPQKRNPDAAELVRGKAGQAIGALVQLLVVLKGLPLTYGKDMQEDKETVFLTVDNLSLSLAAMTRHGPRSDGRYAAPCARPATAASSPRRISPTGWCAIWAWPSARPITSPARWCAWPSKRAAASPSCRWPRCSGSSPASRRSSGPASRSRPRSRAAPARAARRRRMCGAPWPTARARLTHKRQAEERPA